jgi:hypothetical protein
MRRLLQLTYGWLNQSIATGVHPAFGNCLIGHDRTKLLMLLPVGAGGQKISNIQYPTSKSINFDVQCLMLVILVFIITRSRTRTHVLTK